MDIVKEVSGQEETAVFGGGCFWCVEAAFLELEGVVAVTSGYAGGIVPNPTYEQVCTGETGHAEVVAVRYDPSKLTYERLLEVFWLCHDPTSLNRQGGDVGTQYRSVIFYRDAEEKDQAAAAIAALDSAGIYPRPIVTTLEPLEVFYPAEAYHHNYYARNPHASYCAMVIRPKLDKVRRAMGKSV